MHFKQLPDHLKPREKARKYGVANLSDIELLAIFLRNGTSKLDVIDLSKQIIYKYGGVQNLKYVSNEEFKKIYGIGEVKAIELQALFEFINRVSKSEYDKVMNIDDAARIALSLIGTQTYESFLVIFLNQNNEVIYKQILYKGTRTTISIEPKEVISLALKKETIKFYCFHNHPSGDLSASKADQLVTTRLNNYSQLFGIELIGHYIVNKDGKFARVE